MIINGSIDKIVLYCVLSSDHRTPAVGKTVAITISINGSAFVNPSGGATNATEIGSGWYYFTPSNTDTGTNGPLIILGTNVDIDNSSHNDIVGNIPLVQLADGVAHGGTPGSSTATYAGQLWNLTNPNGTAFISHSTGNNGKGMDLLGNNNGAGLYCDGGNGFVSIGEVGHAVSFICEADSATRHCGLYLAGSGDAALFLDGNTSVGAGLKILGYNNFSAGDGDVAPILISAPGITSAISIVTREGHGIDILAAGTGKKALLLAGDAAIDSLAIAAGSNPPVNIFSELGGITLANDVTHGGNAAILSLAQITVTAAAASDNAAFILRGDGSGAGFDVEGGTTGAGFDIQGGGTSGNAISVTGIHGHGIRVLGGSSGSWNGITVTAGSSTDSAGVSVVGNGSGSGLNLQGGATGDALDLFGGSTSGFGIFAQSHGTDCARWVVQSGNGDAFSGIGHGTGVGFRSAPGAVGFGGAGGTVDANIVSSAINVPCILADGVAHGGTPGSSTATFAMQKINIKNPNNTAVSIFASGVDKKALLLSGNATTDSFAIAAGAGTPIDVFDTEGNVKIKIPGI